MKRGWHLVWILSAWTAHAAGLESFSWRAPLSGAWTNRGLYAAALTPGVFEGCRSFPVDLRIYDEHGEEWPFYVAAHEPPPSQEVWRVTEVQPLASPGGREGIQSLQAATGGRQPLRRLQLEFTTLEKACPVKAYGRYTATNSWRWIADGVLEQTDGPASATIKLHQNDYPYVKLDIYHYESPPFAMPVVRVQPEPLYLVLEAGNGQRPYLYFGAGRCPLPHYGLARRVGPDVPPRARSAVVGERTRNPARLAAALGRYGRMLGLGALGVLAGLGLLMLLSQWHRRWT